MTMSKMRLLIPLLGLLAVAATQGCGTSTAANNGSDGSGGSVSSVGGSSAGGGSTGGGGAGGSPNTTSHKVTIVGSGS
jgi:uncharacterized membrane protein YgcG